LSDWRTTLDHGFPEAADQSEGFIEMRGADGAVAPALARCRFWVGLTY